MLLNYNSATFSVHATRPLVASFVTIEIRIDHESELRLLRLQMAKQVHTKFYNDISAIVRGIR